MRSVNTVYLLGKQQYSPALFRKHATGKVNGSSESLGNSQSNLTQQYSPALFRKRATEKVTGSSDSLGNSQSNLKQQYSPALFRALFRKRSTGKVTESSDTLESSQSNLSSLERGAESNLVPHDENGDSRKNPDATISASKDSTQYLPKGRLRKKVTWSKFDRKYSK